jgi:hypothetical protein
MNDNYITIATFTYESEMFILLGKLESEGIRYFTRNRTMLSVRPMLSAALGGISLMVHREDLEQAQEVLKGFDFDQSGKVRLDVVYKGIRYRKTSGFCPRCDESSVYIEKVGLPKNILFPLGLIKLKFYCNACKNLWSDH